MEKVFNAMGCREEQKVNYATYLLCGEDLRKQKAREFLELKQGNMTVGEYTTKFQELMKYWPHYQHGDGEEDLCAQFKHGLRPDIRAAELREVSKSRIFKGNSRGKTVDIREASPVRQDKRLPRFSKGPYSGSSNSQSRGSSSQEKSSGSGLGSDSFRGPIKCFRCGGPHLVRDSPQPRASCGNCGKSRHTANVC
ncbi:uncharacterized protein LOC113850997 [Abrus precatorius]|uniref:Uncharacterized protein LOC113850997 n=1 Tax=Abrus precatorius TaxID=3816 RepID=A0A8B8K0X2_ABRPR|nr:uncharacterized protein LOC113850997 [Abrus precatorius]